MAMLENLKPLAEGLDLTKTSDQIAFRQRVLSEFESISKYEIARVAGRKPSTVQAGLLFVAEEFIRNSVRDPQDSSQRLNDLVPSDIKPNAEMDQYIVLIKEAADMDDLSFMRLTKNSGELETALNAFSAVFDDHVPESVMHAEFGQIANQFARMDSQLRRRIFRDWLDRVSPPRG